MDGREYQAIEQNAEKPSRWGQLAREGHRVVQFKDTESNRFVAVAVDGKITVYPSCPIGCAPPQVRGTLRMTPAMAAGYRQITSPKVPITLIFIRDALNSFLAPFRVALDPS
jgi:hypothetical protein